MFSEMRLPSNTFRRYVSRIIITPVPVSSLLKWTYGYQSNRSTAPRLCCAVAKARTSFGILGAISLSHLLNDMIQSLIPAIYPLLQSEFSLSFMQIGMITLTFQLTSSLLQPVVGYWTDKYPMPWSLPIGMCFTLSGLVLLAIAGNFHMVLLAAALVGTGSSVFHPESSRVARMASGGRHGLAQSIFGGR